MSGGFDLFRSAGVAGAEACAAVFGGAFRPERKLPLQIAATCRVELILDLGSTGRLGGSVPFAFLEAIALTVHLQDMNVMGEPIQ